MTRHNTTGKTAKERRLKADKPERRAAPAVSSRRSSPDTDFQVQLEQKTRELAEARKLLAESLEQQAATSEVLKVISSSPGDVQPVFQAMLANATRLCEANFGVLHRFENGKFFMAAGLNTPPALAEFNRKRGWFTPVPEGVLSQVMRSNAVAHNIDHATGPAKLAANVTLGGARTSLGVPMLKDGELVGAFVIYRKEVRPFTDKQIALVQNFAAQAVIAIENTRLLNELRQRTEDLSESLEQQTATSEVLKVISSSPGELGPVFNAMLENASRICEAKFGILFLCDGDGYRTGAMHNVPQALAEARRREPLFRPASHTAIGRMARSKQAVQIADMLAEPGYFDAPPGYSTPQIANLGGARTVVSVPMLKDDELIGAIVIYRQEVRPFTEKQIELVTNFAAQAVIAIENTRLLNQLRESLQQQTATSEVLQVISRSPGQLQPVFDAILENATRICEAKFGTLLRYDGGRFHPAALRGVPPAFAEYWSKPRALTPNSGPGRAVATKKIVYVPDILQTEGYKRGEAPHLAMANLGGARTVLIVPMLQDGEVIGTIGIYHQELRPFSSKQIELIQNFAAQAVIAIENTRLLNELRARTDDLTEALEQQTATSEVLKVISSSPGNLSPVFEAMLANATRICEANFGIMTLHEEGWFRTVALHNAPPDFAEARRIEPRFRVSDISALARTVRTKQAQHVVDLSQDESYLGGDVAVRTIVDRAGARSLIDIPMIKDGEVVGVIGIYSQEVRPFTDKQIELVQNFAAQAVIAIENTRLLSELRESLQQQTATADVLKAISRSTFDLKTVLNTLVESAARLSESDFATLNQQFLDGYRQVASYGLTGEMAQAIEANPLSAGRGSVVGRTLIERRPVQIVDILADPEFKMGDFARRYGANTILGVPLLREGVPIGVMTLQRRAKKPYAEKQIELLTTFADQAVIAIENSRLLNELRQRTDDLTESLEQQTATAEVLKVISGSPGDLKPVFDAMLENAIRICEAKFGNLVLFEGGELRIVALQGAPQPYQDLRQRSPTVPVVTILGRLLETKQMIHVSDLAAEERYASSAIVKLAGARTFVAVPMLRDETLVGAIAIYRQEVRPFTEKQIELVRNFASQAVIAIENARLLSELHQRTDDLGKSLEDLQTAQDRLVQTQKLASLGQLTAGIAHEIKNPLNFVNNFSSLSTELLGELREHFDGLPIGEKARAGIDELMDTLRSNLDKIEQHGKRADSIVKNMLLHSREGSGEHRPVDVNALVEESLNLAYHGARAEKQGFNITLERSLDPAAGEVDVFPQEITRVLLNLISNGFYAATKRKAEAGDGGYEPTLTAATKDLGDRVEIRIRDNGTGIPPEVKDKMFNPFFTTKPAGEGTGLGLSLSHDIVVKQHAGSIEVDTEPGSFTEIRIILPRAAATIAKMGAQP